MLSFAGLRDSAEGFTPLASTGGGSWGEAMISC